MIRTANRPRRPNPPPKPLTTHAAKTACRATRETTREADRAGRNSAGRNSAGRNSTGRDRKARRLGVVMVLSAATMVMIMGFLAFTVDVGFVALTKAQMKGCTDASALAATQELAPAFHAGSDATPAALQANAGLIAERIAALHRSGDHPSAYIEPGRDVQFGQYYKDPGTHQWVKQYDVWPHNFVEVTAHRDQGFSGPAGSGPGDSSLPLFFAPAIGHKSADLTITSTAAVLPGVGFRIPPGSNETIDVLPIALDIDTWNNLISGASGFDDQWACDEDTDRVSSGSDGVREVNIYPDGSNKPPGNRGTVDIGGANNSTADLSRQILQGVNESDMSHLGFELKWDQPCVLNGDTGISAGIKDELETIKGEPRLIPLFSSVSGPGNNAMYTIVKFVGVRIVDVKLTGSPRQKRVVVQPCEFMHSRIIPGEGKIEVDSVLTTPRLID